MIGLILAAGRGSRMAELTSDRPKAMVELAGRSLFEWQLKALSGGGITEVTVVTGYRAQCFEDPGVRTLHNPRWQETNIVRSLLCANELLAAQPAVVSYSDIVYHADAVRAVARSDASIAVAYDTEWESLWSERFADPLSDAESFLARDGFIVDIGRRVARREEVEGQYLGLLAIRPPGWAAIASLVDRLPPIALDKLDMTTLLRMLLEAATRIAAVPVAGRWCEVDSPADVALYERLLAEASRAGRVWAHDWRDPE